MGIGPATVPTSKTEEGTLVVPLVVEAVVAAGPRVPEEEDEEVAAVEGEGEAEEMVSRHGMARLTADCYKCGQSGHWANACPNA